MSYKIEKNVPMPPKKYGRVYPFPDMQVGDSFAFERDGYHTVRRSANYFSLKFAPEERPKFRVSYVECRCWRVA